MKKWKVATNDPAAAAKLAASTDLGELLCSVLAARGLNTVDKLEKFFNASELSDPFLLADMQNAVDAINEAVDAGEKICVFGDFDCDGVTAAAMLSGYLESMGADVSVFIPEREDGYGLSKAALDKIAADGASLVITVDNGISALEEARYAAEIGLKLVITDHHQPSDTLPEALAVVDPHRIDCPSPYKYLCGAGVVLKLCAALDGGSYEMAEEQYSDLAAIATVADVVPLTGENRIIVSKGLLYLKNTENAGLLALMEKSGIDPRRVSASDVAFYIAPRINAASRLGSPMTAYRMLVADGEEAEEAAAELSNLNSGRRDAEAAILADISKSVDADPAPLMERVAVLAGRGWHRGVIGIVAARLAETLSKPVILLSIGENGEAVGSARSFKGFNVFKCLDSCRGMLIKYGGHELAGGLTVREENIPAFREAVEGFAAETSEKPVHAEIEADMILPGKYLTPENVRSLSKLGPFGMGNPEPVFAISGAEITAVRPLKDGAHTKFNIAFDGVNAEMPVFGLKTAESPYSAGDRIDVMARLGINEFRGNESVTLRAVDHRLHGIRQEKFFAATEAYEKFRTHKPLERAVLERGNPTRAELIEIYKYICSACSAGGAITFEGLCARFADKINAFRLAVAVDAFSETGLVAYSRLSGKIRPETARARVDLDSSETLKTLRSGL